MPSTTMDRSTCGPSVDFEHVRPAARSWALTGRELTLNAVPPRLHMGVAGSDHPVCVISPARPTRTVRHVTSAPSLQHRPRGRAFCAPGHRVSRERRPVQSAGYRAGSGRLPRGGWRALCTDSRRTWQGASSRCAACRRWWFGKVAGSERFGEQYEQVVWSSWYWRFRFGEVIEMATEPVDLPGGLPAAETIVRHQLEC